MKSILFESQISNSYKKTHWNKHMKLALVPAFKSKQWPFAGAFIFPFLIMMVLEGMPLVLLELAVGQKFRQGSFGVWNMIHPWLGGIGLGSTVIAVIVGCYYNMIIAWCIYYLGNSFWVSFIFKCCHPSGRDLKYINNQS